MISDRLKTERENLGLSQQALADRLGISLRSQQNYEKGDRNPDSAYLAAIAAAGADVLYILTGQHAGGVKPAPTLTAEEETLLSYFRDASKEVRRAALGALLGASAAAVGHASGSGQHNVGDNAIQIGSVSGKARVKNR